MKQTTLFFDLLKDLSIDYSILNLNLKAPNFLLKGSRQKFKGLNYLKL
jgi:hypothetical protein